MIVKGLKCLDPETYGLIKYDNIESHGKKLIK